MMFLTLEGLCYIVGIIAPIAAGAFWLGYTIGQNTKK